MEEEEELRVWEAFSGAAKNPPALDSSAEVNPNPASDPSKASDAAGGNADALDKDRPQKWQRADGKGNARPGGHRNRLRVTQPRDKKAGLDGSSSRHGTMSLPWTRPECRRC